MSGVAQDQVLFVRSGLASPLLMLFVREDALPCDVFPVQGGYQIHVADHPPLDGPSPPPELADLFAVARREGKRWLFLQEPPSTADPSARQHH